MKKNLLILFCLTTVCSMAQKPDTSYLRTLFESKPALFSGILNHPGKNEVQVLYTRIDRDARNRPKFTSFSYNLDPEHYFYPASTVKLAACIFALEKVNALKKTGLTAKSTMLTDSSFAGQTAVLKDETAGSGLPSVEHYIKKILLTSDNDAFNRLYEFIGRAEINEKLKHYGLLHSRILNRLAIGDTGEPSKHTNAIRFLNDGKLVYTQPPQYDPKEYPLKLSHTLMGRGYLDSADRLVNKPFSLAGKNAFSIADQQSLMKRLMFPSHYPAKERFRLSEEDYKLIYTYMSKLPTESDLPAYNPTEFWPAYAKMIYYGRDKNAVIEPHIRIFNKYGDSYGYIIDNAYFVDFKNQVEFLLTAVVQSNEDGIYNDNKYEYETVCYPFMKNLGRSIYEEELTRKKAQPANLEQLRFSYQ
ncbi:hypothetical protein C7T94_10185 [Pedobacter yulinensis]|uniref:Beta-lactamase class A catalytic domain-containing protein n=1 Tax=Pedobacter yulinensis TaxID=2126353 RepID=A0A2T3HKL9_9SPHI|nr:serine hydrolase [Pedobacter yulinensis]PST82987.1 hypothetical protein C7T94_10185 [Pedobacter yulinensis]